MCLGDSPNSARYWAAKRLRCQKPQSVAVWLTALQSPRWPSVVRRTTGRQHRSAADLRADQLFPASSLTGAQHAYRTFNRVVLLLLILTPLAFIAALWASPRRRRTLLQLTIAGMPALIVVRGGMYWLESDLTAAAKRPTGRRSA